MYKVKRLHTFVMSIWQKQLAEENCSLACNEKASEVKWLVEAIERELELRA